MKASSSGSHLLPMQTQCRNAHRTLSPVTLRELKPRGEGSSFEIHVERRAGAGRSVPVEERLELCFCISSLAACLCPHNLSTDLCGKKRRRHTLGSAQGACTRVRQLRLFLAAHALTPPSVRFPLPTLPTRVPTPDYGLDMLRRGGTSSHPSFCLLLLRCVCHTWRLLFYIVVHP